MLNREQQISFHLDPYLQTSRKMRSHCPCQSGCCQTSDVALHFRLLLHVLLLAVLHRGLTTLWGIRPYDGAGWMTSYLRISNAYAHKHALLRKLQVWAAVLERSWRPGRNILWRSDMLLSYRLTILEYHIGLVLIDKTVAARFSSCCNFIGRITLCYSYYP